MSLQWTLIATFLYTEIAVVILLLIPFISPSAWQRILRSRFFKAIGNQANIYFTGFLIILFLFFLDSIREVRKYSATREHETEHSHLDAELQLSMKLFRAQRNFYIAGFALFLCLVIRRLVTLIHSQATMLAQCEASMKQAQSATEAARRLMKEKENKDKAAGESAENEGNVQREEFEKEIQHLNEVVQQTKEELQHAKTDLESMKKQAESVGKEYDRLMEEHRKLQLKHEQVCGSVTNKKEE